MANTLDPVRMEGKGMVQIFCSFATNAGSNPAAASNRGVGFTQVLRTGAGTYEITLSEKYANFLGGTGTMMLNAAGDSDVQLGAYTAATATALAKVVVRTMTAGAAADIAANANNRVNVTLYFTTHEVYK